jgi:hypothetical protein
MAFDDDAGTIWHTRWSTGSDPYPHEMQIDLGDDYHLFDFTVQNRSNGPNGRIKEYEIYLSDDPENWGDPVAAGEWTNTAAPQTIAFDEAKQGRYFRLLALSEVNGNAWSSAAEFYFTGCLDDGTAVKMENSSDLKAFPMPVNERAHISLPHAGPFEWQIYDLQGKIYRRGMTIPGEEILDLATSELIKGLYILQLRDEPGRNYRVKIVKQ